MPRWTAREDRFIRRVAETHTAKQIAAQIGRTPNAVHQRAYLLKIKLQKAGDRNPRTKYPDRIVEVARELHEERGLTSGEIAQAVGVPEASIKRFITYKSRGEASLTLLAGASR